MIKWLKRIGHAIFGHQESIVAAYHHYETVNIDMKYIGVTYGMFGYFVLARERSYTCSCGKRITEPLVCMSHPGQDNDYTAGSPGGLPDWKGWPEWPTDPKTGKKFEYINPPNMEKKGIDGSETADIWKPYNM